MVRKMTGCEPVAGFEIPGSTDPVGAECCRITKYDVHHDIMDCTENARPAKSVRMTGCYIEPSPIDGHVMDKKILEFTNSGARSPGPANYCVKPTIGPCATDPSIEKNPAYSMPGKRTRNMCPFGPGPAYNTSRLTREGVDHVPGGRFGVRFPYAGLACTPGPAEYCVKSALSSAGHRIGPRPRARNDNKDCGPAPNAYCLRTGNCRLRTTMGMRFCQRNVQPTPGPGHYNMPPADLYLPGRFATGRTIGRRFTKGCKAETPGPASYDGSGGPKCCKNFTFGAKIPDTVPTFSVTADNQHFRC